MRKFTILLILCTLGLSTTAMSQGIKNKLMLEKLFCFIDDKQNKIPDYKLTLQKHSTLLKVLQAADLDKILGYNGYFTVLAPSNFAFENLCQITVKELLQPKNHKKLKAILTRHIIAGKLTASSILTAMSRGNGQAKFTTLNGDKVTATMNGVDIELTDKAGNYAVIVSADSNYSNGVVHEIDCVFVPETIL